MNSLICARQPGTFKITKVKGHATQGDVRAGRISEADRAGNRMADMLAKRGAAQHDIDPYFVAYIQNKKQLTKSVHNMMLEIMLARQAAMKDDGQHHEN